MRICAGCSYEYQEDFKFCPDCGRGFGQAGDAQIAKLNSGLSRLVTSANREVSMQRTRNFTAPTTESAREAAQILTRHDPGIRSATSDG